MSVDIAFLRSSLAERATELAVTLLGEPNRAMSSRRELRFGRHGSLSVVVAGPKAGMWHDHQVGTGGDMLALIMRPSVPFLEAVRFAEQFIGQAPRERSWSTMTSAAPVNRLRCGVRRAGQALGGRSSGSCRGNREQTSTIC